MRGMDPRYAASSLTQNLDATHLVRNDVRNEHLGFDNSILATDSLIYMERSQEVPPL